MSEYNVNNFTHSNSGILSWAKSHLVFGCLLSIIFLMSFSFMETASARGISKSNLNTINLIQQSPWVTNGESFSLTVSVPEAINSSQYQMRVVLYNKLNSRSAFAASLQDHLGEVLKSFPPVPLASLEPTSLTSSTVQTQASLNQSQKSFITSTGNMEPTFSFEVNPSSQPSPSVPYIYLIHCPPSGCTGVYPVEIVISSQSSGKTLYSLLTQMVYFQNTNSLDKLGLAWIIPLILKPSDFASSSTNPTINKELAQLIRTLGTINDYPQVPLTLAFEPKVLETLESADTASKQLLATLRTQLGGIQNIQSPPSTTTTIASAQSVIASGGSSAGSSGGSSGPVRQSSNQSNTRELLPLSYVPINIASLVSSNLLQEAKMQLQVGSQILNSFDHQKSSSELWVSSDPLTRPAESFLQQYGFQNYVLPPSSLSYESESLTPTQPWILSNSDKPQTIVGVSDPGLINDITSTSDPVLQAHRIFADLVQIWADEPNQTKPPRAVILNTYSQLALSPTAIVTLLQILENNPVIVPITLNNYFGQFENPSTVSFLSSRSLSPNTKPPIIPTSTIRQLRQDQLALQSSFGSSKIQITKLNETILTSQTSAITDSERNSWLQQARFQISKLASTIALTGSDIITLTSQSGTLPIAISSSSSTPVRIEIAVRSDKLGFPSGSDKFLQVSSRSTTESFRVTTKSPGVFPVRVSILAPRYRYTFSTKLYTVRSTAFSGAAIFLTCAAIGFLILWWLKSVAKSRKERQHK